MLVYTAGEGVHGFTLDPSVGEFLLSHPNIQIPKEPLYFSVNLGHRKYWSTGVQHFSDYMLGADSCDGDAASIHAGQKGLSLRYVGSLVADFHRTLLSGGIFYYPADNRDPKTTQGKLRLLYEAAPLAFIAQEAGGYASDGRRAIMDITPEKLHQRTPLFIGDRALVEKAEEFISRYDDGPMTKDG
jgi:fructose-1,6-bisphosphatase I